MVNVSRQILSGMCVSVQKERSLVSRSSRMGGGLARRS